MFERQSGQVKRALVCQPGGRDGIYWDISIEGLQQSPQHRPGPGADHAAQLLLHFTRLFGIFIFVFAHQITKLDPGNLIET